MITHISHTLAQQIVNTIKDVCSYDINFINPSGTIIASTNSARIGTYHEIGRKAAVTGTTIEVAESDNFTGTRQGINMPLYHEDCLLAVIGITSPFSSSFLRICPVTASILDCNISTPSFYPQLKLKSQHL